MPHRLHTALDNERFSNQETCTARVEGSNPTLSGRSRFQLQELGLIICSRYAVTAPPITLHSAPQVTFGRKPLCNFIFVRVHSMDHSPIIPSKIYYTNEFLDVRLALVKELSRKRALCQHSFSIESAFTPEMKTRSRKQGLQGVSGAQDVDQKGRTIPGIQTMRQGKGIMKY